MGLNETLAKAEQALGEHFGATPRELDLDPHLESTSAGVSVVHADRNYRGIPFHGWGAAVHIAEDGSLLDVVGDRWEEVEPPELVPFIDPAEAVAIAIRHVRRGSRTKDPCKRPHDPSAELARRRWKPRVIAVFPAVNRPTVFAAGPFNDPITADLVFIRNGQGALLGWRIRAGVRFAADYLIIVGAEEDQAGRILDCSCSMASVACSGKVFVFSPDDAARSEVPFPRPLSDFPDGMQQSPKQSLLRDWVAKDATKGSNVVAGALFTQQLVHAQKSNGKLLFDPAPGSSDEEVVSAFFVCNFLRDFFCLLGFAFNDVLDVRVLKGAHSDANVRAFQDGKSPEMVLGRSAPTGIPVALDGPVVIHEFVHVVTQRAVGGKKGFASLHADQSAAMGEGWSDYFAVTIRNYYFQPDRLGFGTYAAQSSAGIRSYANFPFTYGQISGAGFNTDIHKCGSIFASALIGMNESIGNALNDRKRGHEVGWQLVFDCLKKLSDNPNFLHGREQILSALRDASGKWLTQGEAAGVETAVRGAFAARGMGRGAASNGSSFAGVTEDFNV